MSQGLSEGASIPDFVRDADEKHPGIMEEYSALTRLARPLLAEERSEGFKHTVLLKAT